MTGHPMVSPSAVDHYRREVRHEHPHLGAPRYDDAIDRYAVLLARVEQVEQWLAEHPRAVRGSHPVQRQLRSLRSQAERIGRDELQIGGR